MGGVLLFCCGLLLLGGPRTALGEEEKPKNGQETAAPAEKPKTVPMGDVGVESERAKRRLRESQRILEPTDATGRAAETIPLLQQRVDAELKRSDAIRAASPSVLGLDRLQKEWAEIREALAATQTTLRKRGTEIDEHVVSIRETRTLWTETRKAAIQLEVSAEVIAQIDEVLVVANEVGTGARARQAQVLGLQSDVESLNELAAADIAQISDARNQVVGQVLQRDVAPIWSPDFWRQLDARALGEQLSNQEQRDTDILVQYWQKHEDRVLIYVALTALLVTVVFLTRNRIDSRLAEEETLAPVRAMFRRPIALSLLVSFFASLWLFGELVASFAPAFGAATLIPAVIILRQVVDRPMFPLLTVGLSVFFLHEFQELIADAEVLSRLIFMGEMLVLALYSLRTLQPSKLAEIPAEMAQSRVFRIVGHGLRAVLVASIVCFFAMAVGYAGLARLLGNAIVFSIYAAIVLYGTLRVLDGVVAYLLRVRPLRLLSMVRHHRWLIRKRARLVMQAVAWFIWIRVPLTQLELWDDLTDGGRALLDSELPFPEITLTVRHLVAAALVFWGALLASRFIQFAMSEEVFTRVELQRGRPYAITTLLHYTFLILGFVLAAAALGFDANRATLLTGAFGVGIGFGLQTIVNNFISGIILLTERPIQVGDTVELTDVFGEVQRIGIRSSTVRTWQGAEAIVPNADLISQQVINWTKSDRKRRMEIPVGVKYGTDPQIVMDVLMRSATENPQVLEDPEPYVLFRGFGESSLDFELRAWTDEFDFFQRVRSAVCVEISRGLAHAEVEIPFPQRDLHIKTLPGDQGNA